MVLEQVGIRVVSEVQLVGAAKLQAVIQVLHMLHLEAFLLRLGVALGHLKK